MTELENEASTLKKAIAKYEKILSDPKELDKVIRQELQTIAKKYAKFLVASLRFLEARMTLMTWSKIDKALISPITICSLCLALFRSNSVRLVVTAR